MVSNPLVKDVPKDIIISSLSLRLLDPVGQGIVLEVCNQSSSSCQSSILSLLSCWRGGGGGGGGHSCSATAA